MCAATLVFCAALFSGATPAADDVGESSGPESVTITSLADLDRAVPSEYVDGVVRSLELAGENADEVLAALDAADEADVEALCYLIAYLPPVDLATADSRFLLDTVSLTRAARERFPWADSIPEDVYLAYVLSPRVSQEPLENWRPYLMEQLSQRLAGATSMEEAALEVNRWCGERVTYKPTQRRDQGVFETLSSGYGRCEEMMIVHISALRSVGIPARQTWTPYWATTDNNHAWTELWVDGEWRYTGACEPRDALDDAWFNDAARNAAIVLSSVFGKPADDDEAYRVEDRFSLVNSIARYTAPGRLTVSVTREGAPAEGVPVTVSVWNFGALRAIARQKTGADGNAGVTLGDGAYFVCAGEREAWAWRLCEISEARETLIELVLDEGTTFDGAFRLNYTAAPEDAHE